MRNLSLPAYKAAFAALFFTVAMPETAMAQGFLESLFGAFTPKNPAPQPAIRRAPSLVQPSSKRYGGHRANPFDARTNYHSTPQPRKGRYRTLCVRLCDGYYFPISNSTPRRQLYEAAEQCQSRCDSETRMFYTSSNSSTVKAARDMEGRSYGKLRNAFVYRKKLVKGCSCRAKPWSVAERIRHRSYADVKTGPKLASADTAAPEVTSRPDNTVTQPQEPEPVGGIDPMPIAQPRPVRRYRRVLAEPPRRVVRRPTVRRRQVTRRRTLRTRRRARRTRQKSWGLGASGVSPTKHRQRWPGDPH